MTRTPLDVIGVGNPPYVSDSIDKLAGDHFAIEGTGALLDLASRQQRPLATIKDAAYAWRQAVFFLSVADPADVGPFLDDESLVPSGPRVMGDLVAGLRRASRQLPVP